MKDITMTTVRVIESPEHGRIEIGPDQESRIMVQLVMHDNMGRLENKVFFTVWEARYVSEALRLCANEMDGTA